MIALYERLGRKIWWVTVRDLRHAPNLYCIGTLEEITVGTTNLPVLVTAANPNELQTGSLPDILGQTIGE